MKSSSLSLTMQKNYLLEFLCRKVTDYQDKKLIESGSAIAVAQRNPNPKC